MTTSKSTSQSNPSLGVLATPALVGCLQILPWMRLVFGFCFNSSFAPGTCSNLYPLKATISNSRPNEECRSDGTAHTSKDYRVFKCPMSHNDDLTSDW